MQIKKAKNPPKETNPAPKKKRINISTVDWGKLSTPERKEEYGRRLNRHSSNLHKKINTAVSQFERHDVYVDHHSSKRDLAHAEASSIYGAYRGNMEYIADVQMKELNIPEGCDAVPTKLFDTPKKPKSMASFSKSQEKSELSEEKKSQD